MSEADKMFEELGYKKKFNNYYEHDFGTTIELEEKNKEILNSKIGIDLSYDDYILKQKIKEKIKDLEYNSSLGFEETLEESYKIEVLKELLEDK